MIIATAGHVDHGKTSLVKHLTGVDTDRLPEEKRRGLTINLGYAYRQTSAGHRIGFIDVPGHERFINTMISGVSGIDHALLVVAADDGPMPQTLEHLNVLRVLGVTAYSVVLTKMDRVDEVRMQAVEAQVTALLEANGLGDHRFFRISNISGAGIAELLAHLDACAARLDRPRAAGPFRLSIDRAFELKGVGLVVTGTATSGEVRPGQSLRILPLERVLRVRSLHAQDANAERGREGERCALSLVGDISREQIRRGDWLVGEGAGPSTKRVDARITLFDDTAVALRHLSPVKVYLGAGHYEAQPYLIATKGKRPRQISPGETGFVQLILAEPVGAVVGQRFLLRDNSETLSLGGGVIVDPYAPQWHKSSERRRAFLDAMASGTAAGALQAWLIDRADWLDRDRFADAWNLRQDELAELLGRAVFAGKVVDVPAGKNRILVSTSVWRSALQNLLDALSAWHDQYPEHEGIAVATFRRLETVTPADNLFEAALASLLAEGQFSVQGGLVKRVGRRATVSDGTQRWADRIVSALARHRRKIPSVHELAEELSTEVKALNDHLARVAKQGQVVRLTPQRYLTPDVLFGLADEFRQLADQKKEVGVRDFCDRSGVGRNLAIELLEYFDRSRFTVRRGSGRVVLNKTWPDTLRW